MTYRHTIAVGGVHTVLSLVLLMCAKLAQPTCNVIRSTTITVPIGVDTIRCSMCTLLIVANIIIRVVLGVILETPPAIRRRVLGI